MHSEAPFFILRPLKECAKLSKATILGSIRRVGGVEGSIFGSFYESFLNKIICNEIQDSYKPVKTGDK